MKQNNTYKLLKESSRLCPAVVMLLGVLLVACSQDEGEQDNNSTTLRSTLQVAALSTDDGVATRATTNYPTDKHIGFFVKKNTASGYEACNNSDGVYSTSRKLWLPTPDSIWLNNNTADLSVYAPYDATHGTDGTLKLAACFRPGDGSKDISYTTFTANNKTAAPDLTLTHVYARLTISVTRDAPYTKEVTFNAVGMEGENIYKDASFKPFDASPYTYGATKKFTLAVNPAVSLTASAPTAKFDLLLIPSALSADVTLLLTATDENFKTVLPRGKFNNALKEGKQYQVNVKLKGTILEVVSVTITDWNNEIIDGEQEPPFID